jgi:co-chaperonin GroES (HSP10)
MIKVIKDKVAIKTTTTPEGRTASGLIVPAGADSEQYTAGEVVAVGDLAQEFVTVGARVHFNRFVAPKIKVGRDDLYILRLDDVLAIE